MISERVFTADTVVRLLLHYETQIHSSIQIFVIHKRLMVRVCVVVYVFLNPKHVCIVHHTLTHLFIKQFIYLDLQCCGNFYTGQF